MLILLDLEVIVPNPNSEEKHLIWFVFFLFKKH